LAFAHAVSGERDFLSGANIPERQLPFEIAEQPNPRIPKFAALGIKPEPRESPVYRRNSAHFGGHPVPQGDDDMVKKGLDDHEQGIGRREVLECMVWAGTGVLWGISGGIPHSVGLIGEAAAAESTGFTFLQMSDSHIGFDKKANPDALGTLREAIAKVKAMPMKPSFIIHTGDITHLSKPEEFDNADKAYGETGVQLHYVPGEHDMIDEGQGKAYLERYGKGSKGAGWYSFDDHGVHFIGLVNVVDLKAGGLGNLGAEQLAWLEADLKGKSNSTPIVVFAHIPLQVLYREWGWGTEDGTQALALLKRFGSVTILNGHIHQLAQKVEGNITFHTALSTAFPQPAPGSAPSPGPMVVPADQLRSMLGLSTVTVLQGNKPLAFVDKTLAG
jgi:hypothetical protein